MKTPTSKSGQSFASEAVSDDAWSNPSNKQLKPQLGSFEVTRIERDFVPIVADNDGRSFGAALDDMLAEAVKAHHELQSVTVHIIPEQWRVIADYYQGNDKGY